MCFAHTIFYNIHMKGHEGAYVALKMHVWVQRISLYAKTLLDIYAKLRWDHRSWGGGSACKKPADEELPSQVASSVAGGGVEKV